MKLSEAARLEPRDKLSIDGLLPFASFITG